MNFPKDFIGKAHEVIPGATQWIIKKPNGTEISIVGGGSGLYGDGVNTFEMWDFDEEDPRGYQTAEQVTDYLKSFVIE